MLSEIPLLSMASKDVGAFKIQTTGPNPLKYGLKLFQGNTPYLMIHDVMSLVEVSPNIIKCGSSQNTHRPLFEG